MSLRSSLMVLAAVVCIVASAIATVMTEPLPPLPLDPFWLNWVGFPVVGALILIRKPGNNIGRILLATGVAVAASNVSVLATLLGSPRPDIHALVSQVALMPIAVLIPSLILLFPSGFLPARWWRHGTRLAWGAVGLLILWYVVRPLPNPGPTTGTWYPNPLGVEALRPLEGPLVGSAALVLAVFAVAALTQVIIRYRNGSRIEKHQVKWVLFAALITPLLFLIGTFVETRSLWLGNTLIALAFLAGGNAVAVAVGVAVFKYRLFDIDRIISRTVTYTLVVGLLAAVFFGLVTMLAGLLSTDQPLVVAASTLAVFALFDPMRRRMQGWVDKRFNRSRYDAQRVMDDFAGSLRDRVDADGVIDGWVGVVDSTMQPAAIGVWVRD